MSPAEAELRNALQAIALAGEIVRNHSDLIEGYLDEAQRFDSIGPIIDPTLFKKPERQRIDAELRPLFRSAQQFVAAVRTAQANIAAMRPGEAA